MLLPVYSLLLYILTNLAIPVSSDHDRYWDSGRLLRSFTGSLAPDLGGGSGGSSSSVSLVKRSENSITDYTFEDIAEDIDANSVAPKPTMKPSATGNNQIEDEAEMYINNHQHQQQQNENYNSRHYNNGAHYQPGVMTSHNKFVPHYSSSLNLNYIHSILSKSQSANSISNLLSSSGGSAVAATAGAAAATSGSQMHLPTTMSYNPVYNQHHHANGDNHNHAHGRHQHGSVQPSATGATGYSPYYSAAAAAALIGAASANQQQQHHHQQHMRPQPSSTSFISNSVQDQSSPQSGASNGSLNNNNNNYATTSGQGNSAENSALADLPGAASCGRQQVGGFREPRIVGGNSTYEGEFPWAVSIQRHGNHHCGGVIVGRRWILTAAHCVRSQLVGNLIVRTGGHTLSRSAASSQNNINSYLERDYSVEQIVMHDDFSRYDNMTGGLPGGQMKSSAANANNADIALLRLRSDILWNEFVWPVCFPSRESGNFSGHDAIVIGWGKLSEKSEDFSSELQKVKLTIIDNKVCQNWFRQAGREMQIDDRIICAGFKNGGKDACHGDSGGPLLSRINGQYAVVGVVSTGIGCARPLLPGLYSRVSSYINWVERHITN